jgi:hypothetical protein
VFNSVFLRLVFIGLTGIVTAATLTAGYFIKQTGFTALMVAGVTILGLIVVGERTSIGEGGGQARWTSTSRNPTEKREKRHVIRVCIGE